MTKTLHSQSGSHATTPTDGSFSLIPNEKLLALYAALLKCRMLGQRVAALFQQGKLENGIYASCTHEASAAALSVDLEPADTLCIVRGDWLPAFVKGLPLEKLFRALAPSAAQRRGLQPFVAAESDATNILIASDATHQAEIVQQVAATIHDGKSNNVVLAFVATNDEMRLKWRKLISTAAIKKLSVVFVEHLDQISPDTQPSRRGRNREALLHGAPMIAVDASDPVALYRVGYEAISRARQRRGATLIQCVPGPVPENAKSILGHRSLPDPVTTMETYLRAKGIESEPHNRQVIADFNRDLDLATRFLEE